MTKKGLTNIHMVFEENKKNLTCYSTPYGNLMIGIEGGPVSIQETDDRIEVRANYSLDINYEHVANCEIRMHIQSKEAQQFSLIVRRFSSITRMPRLSQASSISGVIGLWEER